MRVYKRFENAHFTSDALLRLHLGELTLFEGFHRHLFTRDAMNT